MNNHATLEDYLEILPYLDYQEGKLIWKEKPNKKASKVIIGNECGGVYRSHTRAKRFRLNKLDYFNHRAIFVMHYGYLPQYIRFIDGNKDNTAIENLRPLKKAEFEYSKPKNTELNTTSKYKGVYWCSRSNKWAGQIKHNKKKYHLGYFSNEELAAKEYDNMALKLFGENTFTNF